MKLPETDLERMNPVPGGRWLMLPVVAATEEDACLSCLLCGNSRCEYMVRVRTSGTTSFHGLHSRCWERNIDKITEALCAAAPQIISALAMPDAGR